MTRSNRLFKRAVKSLLKSFELEVAAYGTSDELRSVARAQGDIEFLRTMCNPETPSSASRYFHQFLEYLPKSKSQFRQDLFVLSQLDFATEGFFVEFGATNGIELSNTHLLEKEFGWSGILAEPARTWHGALRANRNVDIETRCVWKDSRSTLTFNEVENAGLSTISTYNNSDLHRRARRHGTEYTVDTISLSDLLEKYNAPRMVDYLSIDTEGSEFEILSNFDFAQFSFRVITCEHNFTPMRREILKLLTENGYVRVFPEISFNDDWYVAN
ncbi:FkbM family methyltransferase [Mycolicibacterium sp. D5.8-2]|uniref:FkbM family methyltransferase n=1 Tax=Mycolicibacterium sp. D5.8-2 TaxID=3085903 RepID=UPI00298C1B58|nr:FkbM family methyltransferase [Mycolicibacterium sp. D5.8-2]MDW5612048.1 FkbM family methyltransferase [Mycolicibacterium sp. D5.8-2]